MSLGRPASKQASNQPTNNNVAVQGLLQLSPVSGQQPTNQPTNQQQCCRSRSTQAVSRQRPPTNQPTTMLPFKVYSSCLPSAASLRFHVSVIRDCSVIPGQTRGPDRCQLSSGAAVVVVVVVVVAVVEVVVLWWVW